MCETSTKLSISKAFKNIGIEPLKGWDIFRKIQRKANFSSNKIIKFGEGHFLYQRNESPEMEKVISEMQIDYEYIKIELPFSEEVFIKLNTLYKY